MANCKQICMEYMRREKIRYEDVREHVIKITYKGENLTSIPVFVYFIRIVFAPNFRTLYLVEGGKTEHVRHLVDLAQFTV